MGIRWSGMMCLGYDMKAQIIIIFFLLFLIPTCSAYVNNVTNGDFETGDWGGWSWTSCGDIGGGVHSNYKYSGDYGAMLYQYPPGADSWSVSQRRVVDCRQVNFLSFDLRIVESTGKNNFRMWQQGQPVLYILSNSSTGSYFHVEVDVTDTIYRNQYQDFYFGIGVGGASGSTLKVYVDNIMLTDERVPYNLFGYVTNNLGNSVSSATITLNNSGGSTTSNDTGYYEFTGLYFGTYTITATSPTHQDYSDTVSITADTEKNITMTRLSPVLTWTDAETTKNDVYLKWRRNAVVDNVRIYKDTETRLLTTVSFGSTLAGLYSDRNLDCDKGYVYWLQPMDNDIAGPKYRIDAKTDPCDGGGGGGGDPTPTPSPTATPGPTPPPWTNITQEEWLNLTLDQKQEILANMSLFPPLLEFQWDDIYVWGIHLFLILCGAVALDSITIQKVSEYTGLWAILPGVMFAYLTGYLVI